MSIIENYRNRLTVHLPIKRNILAIAIFSATLIFLIRLFEARFLTGEISMKIYILIIGTCCIAAGIWFGLKFTKRETIIKIIEKKPEVKSNSNDLLTSRETELLALIAMGLSNKEIADRIFVSVHTVKKHLNNLYSKLEVTSRTQAVSKAKELGIINN